MFRVGEGELARQRFTKAWRRNFVGAVAVLGVVAAVVLVARVLR